MTVYIEKLGNYFKVQDGRLLASPDDKAPESSWTEVEEAAWDSDEDLARDMEMLREKLGEYFKIASTPTKDEKIRGSKKNKWFFFYSK